MFWIYNTPTIRTHLAYPLYPLPEPAASASPRRNGAPGGSGSIGMHDRPDPGATDGPDRDYTPQISRNALAYNEKGSHSNVAKVHYLFNLSSPVGRFQDTCPRLPAVRYARHGAATPSSAAPSS